MTIAAKRFVFVSVVITILVTGSCQPGRRSDDLEFLIGKIEDSAGPGAAYVFERANGEWTQATKFVGPTGNDYAWFGSSVCLAGDIALVGARSDDGEPPQQETAPDSRSRDQLIGSRRLIIASRLDGADNREQLAHVRGNRLREHQEGAP